MTLHQTRTLAFLKEQKAAGNPSPSLVEIARHLGLSDKSTSLVSRILDGLVADKYIERVRYKHRKIVILDELEHYSTEALMKELERRRGRGSAGGPSVVEDPKVSIETGLGA